MGARHMADSRADLHLHFCVCGIQLDLHLALAHFPSAAHLKKGMLKRSYNLSINTHNE